ncbi:helix-turn-helix transcriptional regulator [Ramlibacter sp.]|uniref:helix-turn-helix domain-containing protein n=1 Tax=Ramlibacter sp. TaxID=1917967 RepID=UPI0026363770|nr:helix-turn-helix transcriptional regulator [Ramlibacter sp.]
MRLGSGQRASARERLATHMRRLRADAGLSQEMLAELSGLHRTYIGSVERCERNVSVDNIERIAMALQVDVSDLLAPTY